MRKRLIHLALTSLAAAALFSGAPVHAQTAVQSGDLIKLPCPSNPAPDDVCKAVYYFGKDGKRYVFVNGKDYLSWYADFSTVKTVSSGDLTLLPLGGNVTYKPGVRMVKITTDPKVYAVAMNGILRPIASESVAATLYGPNWNKMIDDVPDPFFVNYRVGASIDAAADYDKDVWASADPSINVDKLLTEPPFGLITYRQNDGFSRQATTVAPGTKVTWVVLDESLPYIESTSGIPPFYSSTLHMGQTYSHTFAAAGFWEYWDSNYKTRTGSINVQ